MSKKLYLECSVARRSTILCKGSQYDVTAATTVMQTLPLPVATSQPMKHVP